MLTTPALTDQKQKFLTWKLISSLSNTVALTARVCFVVVVVCTWMRHSVRFAVLVLICLWFVFQLICLCIMCTFSGFRSRAATQHCSPGALTKLQCWKRATHWTAPTPATGVCVCVSSVWKNLSSAEWIYSLMPCLMRFLFCFVFFRIFLLLWLLQPFSKEITQSYCSAFS